jgi:hypothetical protein
VKQSILLLVSVCLMLPGPVSAACSRSYVLGSTPYYLWTEQEWTYSGSHSAGTGISNAAAGWNSVQSRITLSGHTFYDDVHISDDDSIAPLEGITSWITQDQANCANTLDACGTCLDSSILQQVRIRLNWGGTNGITATASTLGWTTDQTVEEIMSHELGHAYRLDNASGTNCTDRSIMSVTDPASCTPNFFVPQSCDADNFTSAYSGWTQEDYGSCGQCGANSCF